ncbi:MAG TPA: Ig-like domain-containing protein [Candidatus Nanoarchaeia archaeon]|nr:Ig-like domain-containing protein [Candidatus Nanoarchaeia archaeon]
MRKVIAFLPVLCFAFFSGCAIFEPQNTAQALDMSQPKAYILSEIRGVEPKESAIEVPTISKIWLRLKDTANTVKSGSLLILKNQQGKQVACRVEFCRGAVCIVPEKSLEPSTTYFVTIGHLTYDDGFELRGVKTWSFTTAAKDS